MPSACPTTRSSRAGSRTRTSSTSRARPSSSTTRPFIRLLKESGFGIVREDLEAIDDEGIGSPVVRRVTAAPPEGLRGRMALDERRPWDPHPPLATLSLDFDLTGP